MKRKIYLALAILGIAVSLFAFSGQSSQNANDNCLLRGTPACPEYPACCK